MLKLGMQSIAQLTRYAIREGLSPLEGGRDSARRADRDQHEHDSRCG